ncbi:highly acidic protein [Campylobacter sp. MIT 21-1685]|nr:MULTISPECIES: highly acidic protein [unclassified Campylobacter]MCX2683064.1 highly acidic protein [Campylobacter sp. MIT 21-1684]MCX2751346.1 highly acidic protein [Campylobacter sp. MIT 21-1682]MCX2807545.1 highly acidic protein [Campylobacter sp. MIT 21-1685]
MGYDDELDYNEFDDEEQESDEYNKTYLYDEDDYEYNDDSDDEFYEME